MATPFVRPIYDNRESTARMSDLIRLRGQSEANALRRQGENSANLWSNIGQIAGNTMADLITIQADEPQRRVREAQAARLVREEGRAKDLDEIGRQTAGMTPEEAATIHEGHGYRDEGAKVREQGRSLQVKQLELERLQHENAAWKVKKAVDVFSAIGTLPEAERPAAYGAALPSVQQMIGPDLAGRIPTQYDPQTFPQLLELGASIADKIKLRADALSGVEKAGKTDREILEFGAKWLSGAENQADLDRGRDIMKRMGASPEVQQAFGETFTPDLPARAAAFLSSGKVEKSLQSKDVLVNGRPTMATFNPSDGTWRDQRGQPIAGDVRPIPPREPADPNRPMPARDNPKFPQGVDSYLNQMRMKGYTRDLAEQALARAWPQLSAAHPTLSGVEVQKALDAYWPLNTFGQEATPTVRQPVAATVPSPSPVGAASPSAGQRTASLADVAAVAARLKISPEEARKQLEARGVVIR